MTLFRLFILMTLVPLPLGLAQAQDPAPGSPQDNACYPGGSMAGKCDTDWEWICGYYLARWETAGGWNTPTNRINDSCISLLPPRPVVIPAVAVASADFPVGGCRINGSGQSVDFGNSYFLTPPFDYFTASTNCTGPTAIAPFGKAIYAPPPFNPTTLCQSAFGPASSVSAGPFGDNIYRCS